MVVGSGPSMASASSISFRSFSAMPLREFRWSMACPGTVSGSGYGYRSTPISHRQAAIDGRNGRSDNGPDSSHEIGVRETPPGGQDLGIWFGPAPAHVP